MTGVLGRLAAEEGETFRLLADNAPVMIWRAAARAGVPNAEAPRGTSRDRETFFDRKVFDPENPAACLASLAISKPGAG